MEIKLKLSPITIFILIALVVLYQIKAILLPFIIAFVLAYLMKPIVARFSKLKVSKWVVGLFILIAFYAGVLLFMFMVIPAVSNEVTTLSKFAINYQGILKNKLLSLFEFTSSNKQSITNVFKEKVTGFSGSFMLFILNLLQSIFASSMAIVNLLSLLIVTPIVTYYLLVDFDMIASNFKKLIPSKYRGTVIEVLNITDKTISAYLHGQLNVCLGLAAYYGITLGLTGLNFGFLVGCLTGLCSFIPFIGVASGLLVALFIAIITSSSSQIIYIIAIFALGQIIEGNFLTPRFVGNKIGLHPVAIIFAMYVFSMLLGFTGILIAIPASAICVKLVQRFWVVS